MKSFNKFQIIKTKCEVTFQNLWTVQRRDGLSINDGVLGYNFLECDYQQAIALCKTLEDQFSTKENGGKNEI